MTPLTHFLRQLSQPVGPNTFNPWTDFDPTTDVCKSAPRDRLERLRTHFSCRPKYLLIGEAPGYQGCKVTGVPFTGERLLLEGRIPRLATPTPRLSTRHIPWSEPSATILWSTLHELGIADATILWNAYPWHPHKAGRVHSNRTPTRAEREKGIPVLKALLVAFPKARIFAVGKQAAATLASLNFDPVVLRHPSMGGASAFRSGLISALRQSRTRRP